MYPFLECTCRRPEPRGRESRSRSPPRRALPASICSSATWSTRPSILTNCAGGWTTWASAEEPGPCRSTGGDRRDGSATISGSLPRYARAAAILGLHRTGTWVLPEVDPALEDDSREDRPRPPDGRISTSIGWAGSPRFWPIMAAGSASRSWGRPRRGAVRTSPVRVPLRGTWRSGLAPYATGTRMSVSWSMPSTCSRRGSVARRDWSGGTIASSGFTWLMRSVADRSSLLDQERALPGETGLGDCSRPAADSLSERGYDGPITAEPLGSCRFARADWTP